ncbi:MAG: hypothetical protein U0793_15255 [Gemmataceae bacterium]
MPEFQCLQCRFSITLPAWPTGKGFCPDCRSPFFRARAHKGGEWGAGCVCSLVGIGVGLLGAAVYNSMDPVRAHRGVDGGLVVIIRYLVGAFLGSVAGFFLGVSVLAPKRLSTEVGVRCPKCRHWLGIPERFAGKAPCPFCRHSINLR